MSKIQILLQGLSSFQLVSVILWISLIFVIPLILLLYKPLKQIIFKGKIIDLKPNDNPKGFK